MAKLSSDHKTVTVEPKDTLSEIAQAYAAYITNGSSLSNAERVKLLADMNHISNPNFIVVGQVIKLSGTVTSEKKNTTYRPTIKTFGLLVAESNATKIYVDWTFDQSYVKEYVLQWQYKVDGGVWISDSDVTANNKQYVYAGPPESKARYVRCRVKAVSQTHKVNGKDTNYWTGGYSSWSTTYDYHNNPPGTPDKPSIEINSELELKATLENIASDINASLIQFEVWQDNAKNIKSGKTDIRATSYASHSWTVTSGHEYKVRCRAIRGTVYGSWSEWSDGKITVPPKPGSFTRCEFTTTKTDVTQHIALAWGKVNTATGYEIEYTSNSDNSDFHIEGTKITINSGDTTEYTVTPQEAQAASYTYYFRYRANNEAGDSPWSDISSSSSGQGPAAPTTWSSTSTAMIGEELRLYWVHNSDGGSQQRYARFLIEIDDGDGYEESVSKDFEVGRENTTDNFVTEVVFGVGSADNSEDKINYVTINTSRYPDGANFKWKVRTAGDSETFGDESVERIVCIYKNPELTVTVTDRDGSELDTFSSFPINIDASVNAGTNQYAIGYYVKVIAQESYSAVDTIGNEKYVGAGSAVYSGYFEVGSDESENGVHNFSTRLDAGNIDLENDISYVVSCTVALSSGGTSEVVTEPFLISWTDDVYEPNAELIFNESDYSMSIRPFCERFIVDPETGEVKGSELIAGISLSIYRREFDGRFTEIATGIDNLERTWRIDPHPALDYARYRIVATDSNTGAISYVDLPGYPIGCSSVIIQWDETWSNVELPENGESAEISWTGSMIQLPYNIDISENTKKEVSLVNYIGRENPVAYYGTHVTSTPSFSVVIPKEDTDTLAALRRLAIWRGDVYVREPSGMGFWASISVSHSQKHLDPTIPVSFDITRVEGGA